LVSTALPSSAKVTRATEPVVSVSKRCIPVWSWPTVGMILIVVSPLLRAALASASTRALSASSGLAGRRAGTALSISGTERARSSRKNLPELTSCSLTTSVYSPGRRGRSKASGSESRASAAGRSNL
jgi:hypothetical protein